MGTTDLRFYDVSIEGLAPLLMHNARLVDPTNHFSREMSKITGKMKKTDEDFDALKRLEFEGGLYWSAELGPYIPGEWIDSVIREGAKKSRKGKQAQASVLCITDQAPLLYEGPRGIQEMYDPPPGATESPFVDIRSVKVKTARIMRTRPRFDQWALDFRITINTGGGISVDNVKSALETAGLQVGMGNYRPKFGRFALRTFELSAEQSL